MSTELDGRGGAAPEYGPLGLNHTLRIQGVGYFYDPNVASWEKGACPDNLDYSLFLLMPSFMTAESIHDAMLSGYRVLPWTEDAS